MRTYLFIGILLRLHNENIARYEITGKNLLISMVCVFRGSAQGRGKDIRQQYLFFLGRGLQVEVVRGYRLYHRAGLSYEL